MQSPLFVFNVCRNADEKCSEYILLCPRQILSVTPVLPLYYWPQHIRHFLLLLLLLLDTSLPLHWSPISLFFSLLTTALITRNRSDTPDVEPRQNIAVYKSPRLPDLTVIFSTPRSFKNIIVLTIRIIYLVHHDQSPVFCIRYTRNALTTDHISGLSLMD
jgi:hypothetical protein